MRAAGSTGWVVGTVFAVLAIFAATWFLVAGPRFATASETLTAAQDARDKNDLLAVQVAKLADQFTHLDEYKTELASLRTQVPARAELSAYVRELDALATANGVTISSLTPSVPLVVVEEAPAPAPVATTETGTAPAGAPTAEATADAAATDTTTATAVPTALTGFVYVPVTIVVVGPYANVTAFLNALQTGTPRIFVPTDLAGERQTDAPDGTPPTALDDLKLTITGNLYVLLDSAVTAPAETPAPEPLPSSDRNPFGSLPGVGG